MQKKAKKINRSMAAAGFEHETLRSECLAAHQPKRRSKTKTKETTNTRTGERGSNPWPLALGEGSLTKSYTLLMPKSLDQIRYWGGAELKEMTLRAVWWFASCNAGIYTPHPHAQMATKKMIPSLPETSHFRNEKRHVCKTSRL